MNGGGERDMEMEMVEEERERRVYMWGYLPGALPQRTPLQSPVMVKLPPLIGSFWKDVCGGGCGFAMALSDTGKLITWGSTDDLGQSYVTSGKHGETPEPFPLPTDSSIVRAAAGWAHCVSVTDRGGVYTWGWKECVPSGKVFGDSSPGGSLEKDTFDKRSSVYTEQVSPRGSKNASGSGSGASTENKGAGEETVKRRRVSSAKQAAESSTDSDENLSALPCLVTLSPGVRISTVAAGGRHTLALSDIGQVWGWGYGGEGQLGLGSRIRMVSSPHPVPCIESSFRKDRHSGFSQGSLSGDVHGFRVPGTYIKGIACGGRHSAAITDSGALLAFGWGLYGQCGQGATDDVLSPTCVSSLLGIQIEAVAAGLWHTLCLSSGGDVYAFGGNQFGQLGIGSDQAETLPRLLDAPSIENVNAVIVSCGARHSAILTGLGFATRTINLGELEVAEIKRFEFVWGSHLSHDKRNGVSFYKPIGIPEEFFSFGHYCQPNGKPINGYILVANSASQNHSGDLPALAMPLDYTLVWNSDDGMGIHDQPGYFWLPKAPSGYKALGFLITTQPGKPDLDEVRCVREDLVDECETCGLLLDTLSKFRKIPFKVFETRPCDRGMLGKGVSLGTFFCSSLWTEGEKSVIYCLRNKNSKFRGMPNVDQIHTLIQHYGPTMFLHPKEAYFPSSVSWFFKNGALWFKAGESTGESIDSEGTNLPGGGTNDGEYWINLPTDERKEFLKRGNLESAVFYVHVKPALGGTFTDLAMWVFSPFNGPATLKIGPANIAMSRTGEHVGDWEHFTLRISNFTGGLTSMYLSQHSGGEWISACDLEFVEGNRAIVYSSRNGHASFAHPGTYLQGSSVLGIGIRNDCARSNFSLDSSNKYEIIAAEYLGENQVIEPCWLQFMRIWGPKIVYDSRKEFDKMIKRLPRVIRNSISNLIDKFPEELSGEEGPTGPKEKNNWLGDERW